MQPLLKLLLAVVVFAIIGYILWDRYFSRSAQIESSYNACMKEFDAGAAKAASGGSQPAPKEGDSKSAWTKDLGGAMSSLVKGFGGAVCGSIKDSCTQDFSGMVCQSALNRFK